MYLTIKPTAALSLRRTGQPRTRVENPGQRCVRALFLEALLQKPGGRFFIGSPRLPRHDPGHEAGNDQHEVYPREEIRFPLCPMCSILHGFLRR